MGGFCQPVDSAANDRMWSNHILQDKLSLLGGYDAIMWSLAIGTCIGLIYLLATVLVPRVMTYLAFLLAFACLLAAGIILVVQPIKLLSGDNSGWNVAIGVIVMAVAVLLLVFFFCYQQ